MHEGQVCEKTCTTFLLPHQSIHLTLLFLCNYRQSGFWHYHINTSQLYTFIYFFFIYNPDLPSYISGFDIYTHIHLVFNIYTTIYIDLGNDQTIGSIKIKPRHRNWRITKILSKNVKLRQHSLYNNTT